MLTRDDVIKLQEALLELGFTLPRWGADGNLGGETLSALGRFMRAHAAEADDDPKTVSAEEYRLVLDLRDRGRGAVVGPPGDLFKTFEPTMKLDDRRKFTTLEHDYGQRPWAKVTGICLHQTACEMGERVDRYDHVGAHFAVTRAAIVKWLHDMNRLIVSANGFNTQCVSIEVDGLYAGVAGDVTTVWDDPTTARRETETPPTQQAMEATRQLCRFIVEEVAKHGGKITALVAHRQAVDSRRNDPGSAIWQSVALPMMAELGLTDGGPGFKIGTGYPIPEPWDARRKGIRY